MRRNAAIAEIDARLRKITGAPSAVSAMRRFCSTVIKASKQTIPPFKIKPLLDVVGVGFQYEETNTGAAEASVTLQKGRIVLAVPKRHFTGASGRCRRWRFSIAHEFGHILLIHALGARVVKLAHQDRDTYRFVENLCDYAASHILIPRTILTKKLRRRGFSHSTVKDLAEQFATSETAMLRAMTDLLPGGGIFVIREYRRHKREEIQPRIHLCSTVYSQSPARPWLPRGCTMKHVERAQKPMSVGQIKEEIENISVVLGDNIWKLDGFAVPWRFVRGQQNLLGKRDNSGNWEMAETGTALVCAVSGKLDGTLFRTPRGEH